MTYVSDIAYMLFVVGVFAFGFNIFAMFAGYCEWIIANRDHKALNYDTCTAGVSECVVDTVPDAYLIRSFDYNYACFIPPHIDYQNVPAKVDCYLPEVLAPVVFVAKNGLMYSEKSVNVTAVYGTVKTTDGSTCPIMYLHRCEYSDVPAEILDATLDIAKTLFTVMFVSGVTATCLRWHELCNGVITRDVK